MRKSFLDRTLLLLAVALGVSTLLTGEAFALRKAPDSATGEQQGQQDQQEFNQLLQERNLARDRARDRLLEMSKPVSDASVTVKVRHRGEDAEAGDRGEVIAEMKMSKDEVANGSSKEIYSKVKASAGSTAVSRPVTTRSNRHDRVLETTARERTAAWMLTGLVGLGLVGWWWYSRRYQPV